MTQLEILNTNWARLRPHLDRPRSTVELMKLSGVTLSQTSLALNAAEIAKLVRRKSVRRNSARTVYYWEAIR